MKARFCIIPVLFLLVSGEAPGSNLDASFALHRVPVSDPFDACGADSPNDLGIPCSDYTITAPLGESYVFVVVGGAGDEGVAGVSFGVYYDGRRNTMTGIDPALVTFTLCDDSGLSFPSGFGYGCFPNPDGYLRATLPAYSTPTCYEHPILGGSGRHALIGYFYVFAHSEDVLRLTVPGFGSVGTVPAAPANGLWLEILDCSGEVIDLVEEFPYEWRSRLGRVHFGGDGSQGYTPCAITANRPSTWGGIKSRYEN